MRDYEELVRRLNEYSAEHQKHGGITAEAADAIEELQQNIEQYKLYLQDAINDLRSAHEKEQKWIPVMERLPLYGQDVLAVRTYLDGEKYQEVLMAHISVWNEETGEKWWNATNITHWMPLPEPPEGGKLMYNEFVKQMRAEANEWCDDCFYKQRGSICTAPDDRKKDCDIYTKLQAADAIEKLQDALLLMVLQYCTTDDGLLYHSFMSAGENAFAVLGLKNGQQADPLWDRVLIQKPPEEE